jgi:hypothetical protein
MQIQVFLVVFVFLNIIEHDVDAYFQLEFQWEHLEIVQTK